MNHDFFAINGFWKEYIILKEIGQGLLSTVYEVKNKNDENNYALKIIDFRRLESLKPNNALRRAIIDEITEKINQMEGLGNNNSIHFIEIYKKFEMQDGIAYTMELFNSNLKKYIKNFEDPKASNVFDVLVELNNAFKILRKDEKIIGDLKLENILLKKRSEDSNNYIFKLSDVGLCQNLLNLIKKSSNIKGNIVYLSPELLKADNYETSCDLWSLGIIIYYFRFKKFPYNGESFEDICKKTESGDKELEKSKNDNFNSLIKDLLEKDQNKKLKWEDYFHHKFFIDRDYSKYYELVGDSLSNASYYSIYKATHKKTGNEKVIKIINKAETKKRFGADDNKIEDLVKYLIRQTDIMQIIENDGLNENTVKFSEYFNTNKEFVIVMEKCDSDLSHYFIHDIEGTLSLEQIKIILNQLNNAFRIMVDKNIIHGDLKLENILLKKNENEFLYKLTDYGGNEEFLKLSENFFDRGSPEFTAPEVLKGNKIEIKSDLWSLGIIIYMLCFREKPYRGRRNINVLNNIRTYGQNNFKSSGNPDFDHLIRKLLTVNINERLTWDQYFIHPFLEGGDCWKYYEDKIKVGEGPYYKVYRVKLINNDEKRAVKAIDLRQIKGEIEREILRPCKPEDLKPYLDDFIKETKNMELLRGKNNDNINAVIFYEYFRARTMRRKFESFT